jgi:hypothetical protein
VKLTDLGPAEASFRLRGSGSGSRMTCPRFSSLSGRSEKLSDGAGCLTVPGAAQETMTCDFGSAPQVRCSCSGSVVVGSGTVVLPGSGAARALFWALRSTRPPATMTAPTPTAPRSTVRREGPVPSSLTTEETEEGGLWGSRFVMPERLSQPQRSPRKGLPSSGEINNESLNARSGQQLLSAVRACDKARSQLASGLGWLIGITRPVVGRASRVVQGRATRRSG